MITKLIKLVPQGGKPYVEPYCGAASLFFARESAKVEVLNDLDEHVINLFRVLQNKQSFDEFARHVTWTLYSRSEFCRALRILQSGTNDPIEKAWAAFVAYNQSLSAVARTPGNWSRTFVSSRGMADNVSKYCRRLELLERWHSRLMRVQIDCRDAIEVIKYWDTPEAVFYCDPPYVTATRVSGSRRTYRYEASDSHHQVLVQTLLDCQGAVVLSGYPSALYKPLEEAGWQRLDFHTACNAASRARRTKLRGAGAALKHAPRIESIWRNKKAIALTTTNLE